MIPNNRTKILMVLYYSYYHVIGNGLPGQDDTSAPEMHLSFMTIRKITDFLSSPEVKKAGLVGPKYTD